MVAGKLLGAYKMHRSVVIRKIVGHRDYLALDALKVSALLCNDKALANVLLSCGKLGSNAASYRVKSLLDGNGVAISFKAR